jgi:hypothetical protein
VSAQAASAMAADESRIRRFMRGLQQGEWTHETTPTRDRFSPREDSCGSGDELMHAA